MKILILGNNSEKFKSCQDIFRLFYSNDKLEISFAIDEEDIQSEYDFLIKVKESTTENTVTLDLKLEEKSKKQSVGSEVVFQQTLEEALVDSKEADNQLKRMARLALFKILNKFNEDTQVPWGILTGIRPTKIVHRLLDRNWGEKEVNLHLKNSYAVSAEKAKLLTSIALRQRKYLLDKQAAKKIISIYIGIPFCPTRCAYCSFPAYSLEKEGKYLEAFLGALGQEISAIGRYVRANNLEVETVYIGGGTPTSINQHQLQQLLGLINREIITTATIEYTVEAGRPDSIDKQKLEILKASGVSRISINPQTMNSKTLQSIGRNHTPEEIIIAFQQARQIGFDNINMDLILGLPGESISDVEKTLEQIAQLGPESLTVHTLALKRASRFKQENVEIDLYDKNDSKIMLELTMAKAKELSMQPYYLYRQKQMRGQLENIGFAKEGFDCVYNVQMMEERQTILGLGAGSGSKLVCTSDWTLDNFYNPKDPLNYIERIDELIARKLNKLGGLSRRA